ncbi:MAG: hypothetical protein IJ511_05480 [Bacteroides sp.]|nr:hypothetical protein [Bacteroides sp.]
MEASYIKTERNLTRGAKVVSALFTPFSIPFLAFLILFLFSYLSMLPLLYKLIVLGIVFTFTILIPALSIFLFRIVNRLTAQEMGQRKRRYVPFLLTIISYLFCLLLMQRMNMPWYMTGIILAALLMMTVCVVLNFWWKLSEHMAGAGAIIGGLVAFSNLFGYNPVGWLCLFILTAGVLGTARITLRHHTLGEVTGGVIVGVLSVLLVLHPASNMLFRVFLF